MKTPRRSPGPPGVARGMGPVGKTLERLVDMHGLYDVLEDLSVVMLKKGNKVAARALSRLAKQEGE